MILGLFGEKLIELVKINTLSKAISNSVIKPTCQTYFDYEVAL
jgi:hypothetical protein